MKREGEVFGVFRIEEKPGSTLVDQPPVVGDPAGQNGPSTGQGLADGIGQPFTPAGVNERVAVSQQTGDVRALPSQRH